MFSKLIAFLYIAGLAWIFLPRSFDFNSDTFVSILLLLVNAGIFTAILVSAKNSKNLALRYYLTFVYLSAMAIHSFTLFRIEFGYAAELEALVYFVLPSALFVAFLIGSLFPKD